MITNWIRNHKSLCFLIFSIVLLLILRAPSLSEPAWYHDEGIHAGVANQMYYKGELYVDGWDNKPPFIYLLNLLYIPTNNTQFFMRLETIGVSILTMIFIYKIVRKVSEGRVIYLTTFLSALLLGLPFLENNIANAENFFILFTTLGIFFALQKKFLITAFFYGLAIFTKAQPFFEFVSILPIVLIFLHQSKEHLTNRIIKLIKMSLLFVLPIALTGAAFILSGNFTEFLNSALLSNFKYVEEASEATKILVFQNSVFLRLIILAVVVLIISYKYLKEHISFDTALILSWLSGSIFAAALSARGYPHYLIQIIPPLLCTISIVLSGKLITLKNVVKSLTLLVIAFLFLNYFFQGRWFPHPIYFNQYYQTGYSYLLGNVSRDEWSDFFDPTIKYLEKAALYVDALTEDGSYTYIVDQNAWFYPLSHTKSATRYVAKYHLWHTEDRTQEALKEIQENMPAYIVRNKNEWVFTELQEYIDSNYTKDAYNNEVYEVWKRV